MAELVAQFPICCIADFQSADHPAVVALAHWKSAIQQVGNPRYAGQDEALLQRFQRTLVFHGALGSAEENWFPWLSSQLRKLGGRVPALMAVGYLLLILSFKARGGNRQVHIEGDVKKADTVP